MFFSGSRRFEKSAKTDESLIESLILASTLFNSVSLFHNRSIEEVSLPKFESSEMPFNVSNLSSKNTQEKKQQLLLLLLL
jgi:hypothetical protein